MFDPQQPLCFPNSITRESFSRSGYGLRRRISRAVTIEAPKIRTNPPLPSIQRAVFTQAVVQQNLNYSPRENIGLHNTNRVEIIEDNGEELYRQDFRIERRVISCPTNPWDRDELVHDLQHSLQHAKACLFTLLF